MSQILKLVYFHVTTHWNNSGLSSYELKNPLLRWILFKLFPGFVLFSVLLRATQLEDLYAQTQTPSTKKWIHSCSVDLISMTAIYLMLIVSVECTVWAVLSSEADSEAQAQKQKEHLALALNRRIEESLKELEFELDLDLDHNDSDCDCDCDSGGCGKIHQMVSGCCAICLDEFEAGDTVVSGRRDCCKSNRFHKSCIHHWLRIRDSCPCCRRAMLETEPVPNTKTAIGSGSDDRLSSEGHGGLRSQWRIRVNTATLVAERMLSSEYNNSFAM